MADVSRPPRLDEISILDRRRTVAGLYLRRVSQQQIAARIGCSQQTISDDIIALKEEWRREHQADIEAVVLRDLAELDTIEADCAQQFAATHEVVWVAARLKCKERRAKLLGLDITRQEHSGPGGGPISVTEVVIEVPRSVETAAAVPAILEGATTQDGAGGLGLVVDL